VRGGGDVVSEVLELLHKIDELAKRHDMRAAEKQALILEAIGICFLLEASADEISRFEEFTNSLNALPLSTDESLAIAVGRGVIADLRSRGIDAGNARQYIWEKLAALEEKFGKRP